MLLVIHDHAHDSDTMHSPQGAALSPGPGDKAIQSDLISCTSPSYFYLIMGLLSYEGS